MNEGAKLRERLRTEGDWKAGSMFLVIFLKSGEPFIHGNDRTAESRNLLGVEDERGTKVVEEAAKAYREAIMSEGYSGLTGVRNAFRVEGGDWKSASIYLYVVSGGGVTLFHGSEPFREGRPTDMTRTDSKGVRFAEELIGRARREGRSFLRYHYDNPAIDGDEDTGSPKFGYAVSFPVSNSEQRAVIGSGIYLDIDGE